MFTCNLCNAAFSNEYSINRHKNRKTACITWAQTNKILEEEKKQSFYLLEVIANLTSKNEDLSLKVKSLESKLVDFNSKSLILDEENNYWAKINIIAPFLSNNIKRTIKNNIAALKTEKDILTYISQTYPKLLIEKIKINKKNLEIYFKNTSECQICFENLVDKQVCKTCKNSYTCSSCELNQIKCFAKCAFCNSAY